MAQQQSSPLHVALHSPVFAVAPLLHFETLGVAVVSLLPNNLYKTFYKVLSIVCSYQ